MLRRRLSLLIFIVGLCFTFFALADSAPFQFIGLGKGDFNSFEVIMPKEATCSPLADADHVFKKVENGWICESSRGGACVGGGCCMMACQFDVGLKINEPDYELPEITIEDGVYFASTGEFLSDEEFKEVKGFYEDEMPGVFQRYYELLNAVQTGQIFKHESGHCYQRDLKIIKRTIDDKILRWEFGNNLASCP